jgi:hypothetical protein
MVMNFRNPMGMQSFHEIVFSREPNVGFVIIRTNGFASAIIIGFDSCDPKVGNLAIKMMHFRFFMKATIWIKIFWMIMDHCSKSIMQVLLYHLLALWRKLSNKEYLGSFILVHPS